MSAGRINVSIEAGHLKPTITPPSPALGKQVEMDGSNVLLYITPTTAKQWIEVLTTIAEETE